MTLVTSLALNSLAQTDEELRFELAARGLDEHISDQHLNIILEDHAHIHIRAHDFSAGRTEERRIADTLDRVEII
jgi:hypothetical protein